MYVYLCMQTSIRNAICTLSMLCVHSIRILGKKNRYSTRSLYLTIHINKPIITFHVSIWLLFCCAVFFASPFLQFIIIIYWSIEGKIDNTLLLVLHVATFSRPETIWPICGKAKCTKISQNQKINWKNKFVCKVRKESFHSIKNKMQKWNWTNDGLPRANISVCGIYQYMLNADIFNPRREIINEENGIPPSPSSSSSSSSSSLADNFCMLPFKLKHTHTTIYINYLQTAIRLSLYAASCSAIANIAAGQNQL